MRIILANKFWYRRGGQESMVLDEARWLADAGHEVAHFSTTHPDNVPSPWSEYFLPYLELGRGGGLSTRQKIAATGRMFYSPEARRRFAALIADFRPDIVHIHGIHRQISPSILDAAASARIPVVQTLHDMYHVCPEDMLGRGGKTLCEPSLCAKPSYWPCVSNRCIRDSLPVSALAAAELTFQRMRGVYQRDVARFISPSRYLERVFAQAGWTGPMEIVANAVDVPAAAGAAGRDGFVVVSRLAREKGILVAVEAARRAGVRLTVVGDGPLAAELRAAFPEIDFTGRLGGADIPPILARSRALLLPSLFMENAPMSILEAMASATPVIASDRGGIPEQITDGVDGLLVPPGDVDALVGALSALDADASRASAIGAAARRTVEERFSPAVHVDALVDVYERVLAR